MGGLVSECEFFRELCERARKDPSDIGMAACLIAEMHSAMNEGRPIQSHYRPALIQFLVLHDVLQVQEIELFPRGG